MTVPKQLSEAELREIGERDAKHVYGQGHDAWASQDRRDLLRHLAALSVPQASGEGEVRPKLFIEGVSDPTPPPVADAPIRDPFAANEKAGGGWDETPIRIVEAPAGIDPVERIIHIPAGHKTQVALRRAVRALRAISPAQIHPWSITTKDCEESATLLEMAFADAVEKA